LGATEGVQLHQRVLASILTVAALLLVPACGLGDKARLEDRITSAPARTEGRIVAGTMTVESRLTKLPAGVKALVGGISFGDTEGGPGTTVGFPPEGVPFGVTQVGFSLDLRHSRATLSPTDSTTPQVVFDDLVLYGRRGGVPADDARPWVRLALDHVDDTAGELDPLDGAAVNAIYAIHPAVIADLAGGTLTGSIERRDDEPLEPGTTHYDVNVSVRKALQDTRRSRYPEDRREAVEELLRLLGVVGDLHRGQVWLDRDGHLRRFRIELRQEPQRKVEFRLIVQLDLPPAGSPPGADAFRTPSVDEVLGVDSVLRFTSTVVATGAKEEETP
jgi:hypothetical protein